MFRCITTVPKRQIKTVISSSHSAASSFTNNIQQQRRFNSTNMNNHVSPTATRAFFAKKMSEMYEKEVPQYTTLFNMVREVNLEAIKKSKLFVDTPELDRITREQHGAIRIGKEEELRTMGRLFAVMGMFPVAYYDLSQAGIPVHSTAFRPIDRHAIEESPFRVFTSLLRIDLIDDPHIQESARLILSKRDIFTPRVRELILKFEKTGGLTQEESEEFVQNSLETFRWHREATITHDMYNKLRKTHPLIADVVGFKGPHINHLTPRTLNIDRVQELMVKMNMNPKTLVEGPPLRECPILLRQTSFNALNENVMYLDGDGDGNKLIEGTHTARFGEIEQRGAALTLKGRKLYDKMLNEVRGVANAKHMSYEEALNTVFKDFPDDWEELRKNELAYFEYRLKDGVDKADIKGRDLDSLIKDGLVLYTPIRYEDFLPVSAAGIFTSNLGGAEGQKFEHRPEQETFEKILGRKVLSELDIYWKTQQDSLKFLSLSNL